jgi:hypothetical protein
VHVTSAEHTWLTGVVETNGITVAEVQKLSGASGLTGTIKQNIDNLSAGKVSVDGTSTMTGNLNLGGNRITAVGTPQTATDAVNRDYVDQLQQGIFWKAPVVVATTANITLSGLQTIDGIALSAGDRVLVKNQSTASQNGFWDAAAGAWTRSADAAAGSSLSSAAVFVREGTTFGDTAWVCTSDAAVAGTDALVFVQFSAAGGLTAGSGITVAGSTVSANIGDGLTFSSNAIVVNPKVGSLAFSSGQLDLANISQAASGNFVKVTLDGYGRVTGNTAVTASDISSLVDSRYVLKAGDTMTGALYGTTFRASQGVPNNTDSSTNGYAFGTDGDSGLFAIGTNAVSSSVNLFLNGVNVISAASTQVSIGYGSTIVEVNRTQTGSGSTTSIVHNELHVNGAISSLIGVGGGTSLNNFASTYSSVYGTSSLDNAQILSISNQNVAIANGAVADDSRVLSFGGYSNGLGFIRNASGAGLLFAVSNIERARFDAYGRFGINNTAPSAMLSVTATTAAASTGTGEATLQLVSSTPASIPATISGSSVGTLSVMGGGMNTGSFRGGQIDFVSGQASSNAGALLFRPGITSNGGINSEAARFNSSKQFLYGTTSGSMYDTNAGSDVGSTYYGVVLAGLISSTNGVTISNTASDTDIGWWRNNSASKPIRGLVIRSAWSSNTAGSEAVDMTFGTMNAGALVERMRIQYDGQVGLGTTAVSSFGHGGTYKILQISNGNSSLNSQAHCILTSNITSTTASAIGSISWALPAVSTAGLGRVAHISAGTGSSHTTSTPQGYLEFAVKDTGDSTAIAKVRLDPDGTFKSLFDNTKNLGSSSNRWAAVYAGGGVITTSDANLKQDITDLDAAELAVAKSLKGLIKKFKFRDAVTAKGDEARWHVGVIAQEVQAAFSAQGLDAHRYGMFCEDTWVDDAGLTQTRLGIRYEELLAFVIAAI